MSKRIFFFHPNSGNNLSTNWVYTHLFNSLSFQINYFAVTFRMLSLLRGLPYWLVLMLVEPQPRGIIFPYFFKIVFFMLMLDWRVQVVFLMMLLSLLDSIRFHSTLQSLVCGVLWISHNSLLCAVCGWQWIYH